MPVEFGKILFINGTSSSGKTTLAMTLQPELGEPFCYYASDQLADTGFRPRIQYDHPPSERQRFFDGFHRSIAAFAEAGNNLIVEHIVEEQSWAEDLELLLKPFDVFWIGLHVPLDVLERRERERKDRAIGEARFHLKTHQYVRYDIEVRSTRPLAAIALEIVDAWRHRFKNRRTIILS